MKMPIGFRFYPTEEELISFYLQRKLDGRDEGLERVIPQLYIYHLNPWDLPRCAGDLCEGEREQWFFFVPRQEKELRGGRPNRLTSSGYWKATGSPNNVYSSENRVIGEKRTMVFYEGRANSTGKKTDWKMNEYRAVVTTTTTTAVDHGEPSTSSNAAAASASSSTHSLRQEFSICRVYLKSKCLRAFDRRPFGGVEASSTSSSMAMTSFSHDQDHNSRDHASTSNVIMSNHEKGGAHDDHLPTLPSTSSDQQQIRVDHPTVEIANSPESSSTGDHANTLYDMDIEEPVWDWKEFDMF